MLAVDEVKIFKEIENAKPTAVAFIAPDGLLEKVSEIASKVEEKYRIDVYISGDPCYGSCDTVSDSDLEGIGVDMAFHVGHKTSQVTLGRRTVMVDAIDDISFADVASKAVEVMRCFGMIGLCTLSQHLHRLQETKKIFETSGFKVFIGRGRGRLIDGQVFGCEFYPVHGLDGKVDAFALLGQSAFHAVGIALSTGKPTYMLDPFLNEVQDVQKLAEERFKRAVLSLYRARDVERFGIIVGKKEGQRALAQAQELKRSLRAHGKNVKMIAMREITEDRLLQFPSVEAFIQTTCPRLSVDGYTFTKPVLSIPQAQALLDLLQGRDVGNFFRKSSWL